MLRENEVAEALRAADVQKQEAAAETAERMRQEEAAAQRREEEERGARLGLDVVELLQLLLEFVVEGQLFLVFLRLDRLTSGSSSSGSRAFKWGRSAPLAPLGFHIPTSGP